MLELSSLSGEAKMIVAAIDVSYSTNLIDGYKDTVLGILNTLKPPIRVIEWHKYATEKTYSGKIMKNFDYCGGLNYTEPKSFMKLLLDKNPIDLYVFTDGAITTCHIQECQGILNNMNISSVKLYFIGDTRNINFKFAEIFEGISQEIYILNGKLNFTSYKETFQELYFSSETYFVWQLWKTLCDQSKFAIFNILAHYFDYEIIHTAKSQFQMILYMSEKKKFPPLIYEFLHSLPLKTVLSVYKKFIETKSPTYDHVPFEDFFDDTTYEDLLFDDKDQEKMELLGHIRVNLATCHPYVICPTTKKYWKDCVQDFNKLKHSYLRLYGRYCEKYKEYPKSIYDLIAFLNEYIFKKQNGMPEIFSPTLKRHLAKVFMIFKEVRDTFSCSTYLKCARKYRSEDLRLQYE